MLEGIEKRSLVRLLLLEEERVSLLLLKKGVGLWLLLEGVCLLLEGVEQRVLRGGLGGLWLKEERIGLWLLKEGIGERT